MTDDDLNPTRPTPHGSPPKRAQPAPDRTHIDKSQRIPPKELASRVDKFIREQWPERKRRHRSGF